jgi:Cys-rich protein (TIGR01571 family)
MSKDIAMLFIAATIAGICCSSRQGQFVWRPACKVGTCDAEDAVLQQLLANELPERDLLAREDDLASNVPMSTSMLSELGHGRAGASQHGAIMLQVSRLTTHDDKPKVLTNASSAQTQLFTPLLKQIFSLFVTNYDDTPKVLTNASSAPIQPVAPPPQQDAPAVHGQRFLSTLVSWAIWVAFSLLLWYFAYPVAPIIDDLEDPKKIMTSGYFECLNDWEARKIFFCACCCPALRWADTMHTAGLLSIAAALAFYFGFAFFNQFLLLGTFSMGVLTNALILAFRHQLKERLQLESWTCSSCCMDFLFVCFCPWCAISQEARAVQHYSSKGSADSSGLPNS